MSGTRLVSLDVDGVPMDLELAVPAGSEPTASPAELTQRAREAFDRAQEAIVAIGSRLVQTLRRLEADAGAPEQVEVTFGLRLSASGSVVFTSSGAEASLQVKLAYRGGSAADA
jgi:NTP-dependent ternary system trypsin peptidase co-occuring protein